jgi:hypothetical protein
MSDIKCLICGEPWDAYGVRHGDMAPWEAKLFRLGAGCPACKGQAPEGGLVEPRAINDFANDDADPLIRIMQFEARDRRPKWAPPEPVVLWTCAGCGVKARTMPASDTPNELEYHVPSSAPARQWWSSHPFHRTDMIPDKEPAHVFKGDAHREAQPVCEFCLSHCDDCGAPISSLIETHDSYDDGVSFPHPHNHCSALCINCLEERCSSCGCRYGEGEDCEECSPREEDNL